MDPYAILGIGVDATDEEVERAYRTLALKYHPDHGGQAWAFKQVGQAYDRIRKLRQKAPKGNNSTPSKTPQGDSPPKSRSIRPNDQQSASTSSAKPAAQTYAPKEIPPATKSARERKLWSQKILILVTVTIAFIVVLTTLTPVFTSRSKSNEVSSVRESSKSNDATRKSKLDALNFGKPKPENLELKIIPQEERARQIPDSKDDNFVPENPNSLFPKNFDEAGAPEKTETIQEQQDEKHDKSKMEGDLKEEKESVDPSKDDIEKQASEINPIELALLRKLQTAPEPNERIKAIVDSGRFTEISPDSVAAVGDAMLTDVSSEVRYNAIKTVGNFGEKAIRLIPRPGQRNS